MKQYYLLLFSCLGFLHSFSQDLLITHKGDTLIGDVKFRGKSISITRQGKPDTVYAADDIEYIDAGGLRIGTVVHCKLFVYSDNIDVVQKWNYDGAEVRDTVLILYEIFKTPKMNLFEVADKERSTYYFIKKPTDSLPVQMIVHFFIQGYKDPSIYRNAPIVSILTQHRTYIDQLRVIMADCPKITQADLEMMDYRSYSFKRIIKRYNKCK